jgi:hypothetical protein
MTTESQEKQKNKILTDLFNSNVIQNKLIGMMRRNYVGLETLIQEDVCNEVFYHLAAKPASYILEIHNRDPKKLIGLAVRIAVLKGFSSNPRMPKDYPNHSLVKYILHGSSLSIFNERIESTENTNHQEEYSKKTDSKYVFHADTDEYSEDESETLVEARKHLTDNENELLTRFMYEKKHRFNSPDEESWKLLTTKLRTLIKSK